MAVKFDVNKGLEHHKSRRFVRLIIIVIISVTILIVGYLVINGRHNKVGFIETNIPDSSDNITKENIEVKENNGEINWSKQNNIFNNGDSSGHKK